MNSYNSFDEAMTSILNTLENSDVSPDLFITIILVCFAIAFVISIIWYIITSISYVGVMKANGYSAGTAWIPFYRNWVFGGFIGKINGFNVTLFSVWFCFEGFVAMIPVVGSLATMVLSILHYVFLIIAVYKSRKKISDNEVLFTVLTVFFSGLVGFFLPKVDFFEEDRIEVVEPDAYV